jgi:hypothetical protein
VAVEGDLTAEAESEIITAQDEALQTGYHATRMLQTDSKCRHCQRFGETVDNIISVCLILAKERYIKRYDTVWAELDCTCARK